jgi:hypothetical protein
MTEAETCAEDECRSWPEYPDETGAYYCKEHYPEPNGGTFEHVPEDYRDELRERYGGD